MASNFSFAWKNLVIGSGVTLSASTAASGFAASNAKNSRLGSKWKGTASPAYIQADFGSTPSDTGVIALIGTDLQAGATIRIRTDNDSAMGSPSTDTGSIAAFDVVYPNLSGWEQPFGSHAVYLSSSITEERYLRVDITSPSPLPNCAVLWAGPVWSPGIGYDYGWTMTESYGTAGRVIRRHEFEFRFLTLSECASILNIMRSIAAEGRCLIIPQDDNDSTWLTEVIYANISGEPKVVAGPDSLGDYRSLVVTFVEATW